MAGSDRAISLENANEGAMDGRGRGPGTGERVDGLPSDCRGERIYLLLDLVVPVVPLALPVGQVIETPCARLDPAPYIAPLTPWRKPPRLQHPLGDCGSEGRGFEPRRPSFQIPLK